MRFNYKTIFHVLFGLFLIALPFSKGIVSVAYVGLLVVSLVGIVVGRSAFYESIILKQILLPVFILIGTLGISLLYSEDINEGLKILLSQSKMIGIPLILALNADLIRKRYCHYVFIFIRGVAIAACITILFFCLPASVVQTLSNTTGFLQEYIVHEKAYAFGGYSPFIDRLQFSYLIVVAFFLECWSTYHLTPPKNFPYLPINFHSSILLIALVILGARGAQLGFLLGIGIWIVGIYLQYGHPKMAAQKGSAISYLILIGGLVCTTVLLPFVAYQTIPTLQERYDQLKWEIGTYQDGTIQNYEYTHFTSIRRLLSWKHSWELIQAQPLLGTGIGDYRLELEEAYAKDQLTIPVHTQSQFLFYWVSSGILSFLVFIGLLGYWLLQGIQQNQYWKKVLFISLFAFYILVLLLDAPLNFQVGAMTFWWIYSFLLIREDVFIFEIP